jgi:C-terminal processing protease CtpA/Prc
VLDVVAGGPAEQAGIKVGDKILAIDGRTPAELPLPAARVKLKTDAPGSKLRLRVSSGGAEREVVLTLRDLV